MLQSLDDRRSTGGYQLGFIGDLKHLLNIAAMLEWIPYTIFGDVVIGIKEYLPDEIDISDFLLSYSKEHGLTVVFPTYHPAHTIYGIQCHKPHSHLGDWLEDLHHWKKTCWRDYLKECVTRVERSVKTCNAPERTWSWIRRLEVHTKYEFVEAWMPEGGHRWSKKVYDW